MWIELFNGPQGLCLKRISPDLIDIFMSKHTAMTDETARTKAIADAKAGDWMVTDGQGTGFGILVKLGDDLSKKSA
jgi:hypothetical protein